MKKKIYILIGTHNKGKFKEISQLLPKKFIKISPSQLKIKSPKETGKTFKANSKLKANYFFKKSQKITLSDDSGIEIDSDTLRLKDAGVSTAKLASDCVTNAKIADDAVQTENLNFAGLYTEFNASAAQTTFETLTAALNSVRAPKDYWLWVGSAAGIKIDNWIKNLTSAQGLNGAKFMVDGKNIDLGMDVFTIYGRTYYKKHLNILDHAELGSSVRGNGEIYLVPNGQIKVAGGAGSQDYLQVRFLEGDGNNFSFRETLNFSLSFFKSILINISLTASAPIPAVNPSSPYFS